ncbi:hypothetical protein PQQ87_24135 [Paraburkholderia nemoris]|uniref:hypothetical protein n=1 Tax=Paraburkholderia TaxID=1822464 RepID=UPI0038BA9BDA
MTNTVKWAEEAHKQWLDEPTARALQAAGVNHMARTLYADDEQRRNAMFTRLQATLPRDQQFFNDLKVSRTSVLGDPARVEPHFRQQFENAVRDCAIAAAHQSPTLRPVTTFDATGREIVDFIGSKKSWMSRYSAVPQIMTRIGTATY